MIRNAAPRTDVCAAILSGGASRRMGLPKAGLLLPDGRSMIETIRDGLETICEQVVLVGEAYGLRGHRVIDDEIPDSGPLAGIEALLRSGAGSRYLIVPCDMPALAPRSIAGLMDGDGPAVHFTGHPLPCVVDAELASTTTDLLQGGVRALRAWLEAVEAITQEPGDVDLVDADTPEAFMSLWRKMSERTE